MKHKTTLSKAQDSTTDRARLVVYRSNRGLAAQVLDQPTGRTILGARQFPQDGQTKTESASQFGQEFGKQALSSAVKAMRFDRQGKRYHGRIKAFIEGVRQAGVQI